MCGKLIKEIQCKGNMVFENYYVIGCVKEMKKYISVNNES